jgi:hypothetical protein
MVAKEKTERMVQTNRQHVRSSANLNVRLNLIAPIRDFNYVQHAIRKFLAVLYNGIGLRMA